MTTKTKLSAARKTYQRLKDKYSDCILLFRFGVSYESFWDDAEVCADVCKLEMYSREKEGVSIPIVYIQPFELDNCLKKLLRAGHQVGVCKQVNNRDVIYISTPR